MICKNSISDYMMQQHSDKASQVATLSETVNSLLNNTCFCDSNSASSYQTKCFVWDYTSDW